MTRFTPSARRRGFTLVELLVVMGLIVTLAAIAMVVTPAVLDRDRSVDAVNQLEQWLQTSRARAQRDNLPRGVRLIIDPTAGTSANPNKLSPYHVTEVQYIEAPPVFVPNPDASPTGAYVQFLYGTSNGTSGTPQAGTIFAPPPQPARICQIRMLTQEQAIQTRDMVNGGRRPLIWLPTLGTWHRLLGPDPLSVPPVPPVTEYQEPAPFTNFWGVNVTLDQYPDAQLGAAGPLTPNTTPQPVYRTSHFGIYAPARPLLGEPAMQLPNRTCIDLTPGVSSPDGSADLTASPARDYDILFAPNGQLAYTASTKNAGHVFLWVRDYRKVSATDFTPTPNANGTFTYNLANFDKGGEMMIVAIKARGAIGIGPVNWPASNAPADTTTTANPVSNPTGTFDPYFLARKAVAGP